MNIPKDKYIAPIFQEATKHLESSFFMKPNITYIFNAIMIENHILHHKIYIDWTKECVIPF